MRKFDFGESFTFMFKDPNWITKFLIGALISLVPILNLAWSGYGVGIIRNMARGDETPLPEWDNIGEKFKDGLMVAIASLVYTLPLWLIACVMMVPLTTMQDPGSAEGAILAISTIGGCCITIYALIFSFFMPAMLVHYARENTFGSLFQAGKIIKLATTNIGQYLMAWIATLVALLVFSIVSPVLTMVCVFPLYLGIVWLASVMHHAYGQVGLIIQSSEAGLIQ
ncbi:MAG: DUF4013 domain-containing protein [Chloroflexota bacterium]